MPLSEANRRKEGKDGDGADDSAQFGPDQGLAEARTISLIAFVVCAGLWFRHGLHLPDLAVEAKSKKRARPIRIEPPHA